MTVPESGCYNLSRIAYIRLFESNLGGRLPCPNEVTER